MKIDDDYAELRRREIARGRRRATAVGGARALLVSVVATATTDVFGRDAVHRMDALKYFSGPVYRNHLNLLGLPVDWLPEGITLRNPT